jgi:hypothetical protein
MAPLVGRFNRLGPAWWAKVAVGLGLVGVALGIGLELTSARDSGLQGAVRCPAALTPCRPDKATVYVVFDRVPFYPNPPRDPYKTVTTDTDGGFRIVLPPGTYWIAAAQEGWVLASDGFVPVTVAPGRMTTVTVDLDLHLPE